jgi:tRNA A37 methylthiotransferase MiaB
MSKKNKRRLERKLIQERLRALEAEAATPAKKALQKFVGKDSRAVAQKTQEKVSVEADDGDKIIRTDLKKVLILSSIIIIILVALTIINFKTNYLSLASDKIFQVLHVGQF